MPRRDLLTVAQKKALCAVATDERDVIRYYTLTGDELAFLSNRRRAYNRLGLAVQLSYLKFPGSVMPPVSDVDNDVLTYVSQQLDISASALEDYAHHQRTLVRHLAAIRARFGYQSVGPKELEELGSWLLPLAMRTDDGFELGCALISELRRRGWIVPPIDVVDRLGSAVRTKAEGIIFERLSRDLTQHQGAELRSMLRPQDGALQSRWAWVLQPPGASSPRTWNAHADRLVWIRQLGLDRGCQDGIHQGRIKRLALIGRRTSASNLSTFEEVRRHAIQIAVLLDLEHRITDELVGAGDQLLATVYRKGALKRQRRLDDAGEQLQEKIATLTALGQALIDAKREGTSLDAAVQQVVAWATLEELVIESRHLEKLTDPSPIPYIDSWYSYVRQFAPRLLSLLSFRAGPGAHSLLDAIGIIRRLNAEGRRKVPPDAPIDFLASRWRRVTIAADGISRHFYELAVLYRLRDALRAGELWVARSGKYRSLEDYLLTSEQTQSALSKEPDIVQVPAAASAFIDVQKARLCERYDQFLHAYGEGELVGTELTDSGVRIAAIESSIPARIVPTVRSIYAKLPRVKVTDLLVEVDEWVNFSAALVHMKTAQPVKNREALFAAILADAINLGAAKMADASENLTARNLMWVADWHLREETYQQALAQVVNRHRALPLAKRWGDGLASSSDGQAFATGGHGTARGRKNARYGRGSFQLFYGHITNQWSPFHMQPISPHERDALYVLDGLLYHQTDVDIEEHYTDTAGFTDHVFAMFRLLGFRFAPRIRDLGDKRLARVTSQTHLGPLEVLAGEPVDWDCIRDYWDELVRIAASIHVGTVRASLIMKKLAAQPRRRGLAKALREVGRVERTFFTLDWLSDVRLRQRVTEGLNRGEAQNALKRAVFMHRLGELRDRTLDQQRRRASGLNLLVSCIVLWNTVKLTEIIDSMEGLADEVVKHLSPIGWEHINLSGDYRWRRLRARLNLRS